MKLALRVVLWISAVALVVIAAAVVFTFTSTFNRLARDQVVEAANAAIRGQLRIGRIDGIVWSGLTLHDVRIDFEGDTLLTASRLVVEYDLLALLGGGLKISAFEIDEPVLRLRQDSEGNWNLLEAVASREPQPAPAADESGGVPIRIGAPSISVNDGRVVVALAGPPPRTFEVENLAIEGGVALDGEEIDADVRRLSARAITKDAPPVELAVEGASYVGGAAEWHAGAEQVVVATDSSRITAAGELASGEETRASGDLRLVRISAEELSQWLPFLPLRADVSGEGRFSGPASDLQIHLSLAAADARLDIDGSADVSGKLPAYAAHLTLTGAVIEQLLNLENVGGVVAAELDATGVGTGLDGLEADGSVSVQALRVGSSSLGDASTRIELVDGRLHTRGELVGPGRANWKANVVLEEERYDAAIETDALDLAGIAPETARLDGKLNLAVRIEGHGFTPAEMDTTVNADIRPSRLGPVEVNDGTLSAAISDNRLQVRELSLQASGATLVANGGIGLAAGAEARLEYALDVPNLEPWLGIVNQTGSGSLQLNGSASGTLDALGAEGRLQFADVRVESASVKQGSAAFDLEGIGAETGWPHGSVQASFEGIEAGQPVESLTADVVLQPSEPPQALVEVDAVMWENRRQHARALIELAPGQTVAEIQELRLDVPVGTWQLTHPTRIVYGAERIAVDDLELTHGSQSITADGALTPEGASQIRVLARDFQLGVVEPFVGTTVRDIQGSVDAEIVVSGTPAQPNPSGTATLEGGGAHLAGLNVTVEDGVLRVDFSPDRIAINELSARADEGRLRGSGSVELQERWPESIQFDLTADRWPAIRTPRYTAVIAADLRAEGRFDRPSVSGRLAVIEADLRPDFALLQENEPPPRDPTIDVVGIEAAATTARAGDEGDAAATVDLMENLALDLTLEAERNTWIKRDGSALEVVGTIEIEKAAGDPTPSLTGSVNVQRGWIYLYGRRFDVERGVITFTGGSEIYPSLDIVLRSRVGEYEVRTIVGGTTEEPTLAFDSTPRLEEADILAVLMFGKPVNELGQGEQVALEEQAANIAAGYVAGRIGRAVGDVLGFQVSEVDVESRRLGVGRYLTPKTYVSVSQELDGEATREVRIEYYLTPRWTIQSQTDSEGESGADLFWKYEY